MRWRFLTRAYGEAAQLPRIPLLLTRGQQHALDLPPGYTDGTRFDGHYYARTGYGWEHVPHCRECQGLP